MSAKRVVIAGGSGFIGRALAGELVRSGYEVVILTRSPGARASGVREVKWDGRTLGEWVREIDGAQAVVNLAGKNVNCRYTRKNLSEIDESREHAVRVMAEAIARCVHPPKVLVQASTTAIYGDAGEKWCDESTPAGDGVPPATATRWENAFAASPTLGVRRVVLRMSFVLGWDGGVLSMLSALTRCFLGGTVGSGRQFISWIHIDDLIRVFQSAIEDESISGLYNATSPAPVTNKTFMRLLRQAHGRPWSPRVPAWAVRLGCFLMRTEPVLTLTGRRVVPRRFLESGFSFRIVDLSAALDDVIGRASRGA